MKKSYTFPSVYEENYQEFKKIADNALEAIKLSNVNNKDFIVGNLALSEGKSPHKLINSSPEDLDYQLLAKASMLIASQGKFENFILTVGFPFSTYMPFKQAALDFYNKDHLVSFDTKPLGGNANDSVKVNIVKSDIITEVEGCDKDIRSNEQYKDATFFIVSLGYGTMDIALSKPGGLVHRTMHSTKGLAYAVSLMEEELKKQYYLNLLTDEQMEKAFKRGFIIINRKKVDLREIRNRAIATYYADIVSTEIKKRFDDEDYMSSQKLFLTGGGALSDELESHFKREFEDIVDIIKPNEPQNSASRGYCIHSMEKAAQTNLSMYSRDNLLYVGLDIGNSNTIITIDSPKTEIVQETK